MRWSCDHGSESERRDRARPSTRRVLTEISSPTNTTQMRSRELAPARSISGRRIGHATACRAVWSMCDSTDPSSYHTRRASRRRRSWQREDTSQFAARKAVGLPFDHATPPIRSAALFDPVEFHRSTGSPTPMIRLCHCAISRFSIDTSCPSLGRPRSDDHSAMHSSPCEALGRVASCGTAPSVESVARTSGAKARAKLAGRS